MIIHNFFSDTALSIYHLFEYYIFAYKQYMFETTIPTQQEHFFKSFQFNLGNKNFQIGNYKEAGQLEFPTAILTFVGDETAFGKEANLVGNHRIVSVNEVLATHDNDTDHELIMREEQSILSFTFQINCESQLQANEVVHQIKRFLPPEKYIQIITFKSFIEIPIIFFGEDNNPRQHTIENLYQKYDDTTGETQYYFLCNYKPLIKLNSVTADIADNSQRSYIVSCDFSYLIQLPMWLFDTCDDKAIARINIGFIMDDKPNSILIGNNPITDSTNNTTKINDIPYKPKETTIVDYNSDNNKGSSIVINKPSDTKDDYAISVTKVTPANSLITDKSNNGNKTKDSSDHNILDKDQYQEKKRGDGGTDIIIFNNNDSNLTPELNEPLIIKILIPMTDDEIKFHTNKITYFDKVYNVRDQKCWG